MKKIVINENQKGLLFKNGRYSKMLDAGKYHILGGSRVDILNVKDAIVSERASLETLLKDEKIKGAVSVVEVKDEQLALHFIDGKFTDVLPQGKYAFWKTENSHEFKIADISSPYVDKDIPDYIFANIPVKYYVRINVVQDHKALLYFNNKFEKILDSGVYYFWKNSVDIGVRFIDTRLTQMNITGQEILTHDKVALRINFVCNYKVTDYIKIHTEIDDYIEQIHITCQLALREYVSKHKFDEILENKEQMTAFVFERLKSKEKELFVEFKDAGVKDIILPGEIRDIMNTVLIAEKKAQANVITRREEVASTRSLLNTAKLMDENKTLYKLKELEFLERICENVGNIEISGKGDVLTQLAEILQSKGA